MSNPTIKIRDSVKEDLPFIFNSWLKSFKLSALNRYIDNPTYFDYHHDVFTQILSKSKCLVACDPTDEKQIFGYLVAEVSGPIHYMHWCYVKEIYRNLGIARALEQAVIPSNTTYYTFFTKYSDKLNRERKYKYLPYYIRVSKYEASTPTGD